MILKHISLDEGWRSLDENLIPHLQLCYLCGVWTRSRVLWNDDLSI